MTFTWPWMLLSLAGIPLLVAEYRRLLQRRDARRERKTAAASASAGSAPA